MSDLGDLLAQNSMAQALFGSVCSLREQDRNIVWRWFNDPALRKGYSAEERDRYSRVHVADLRAAVGRRAGDATATGLVRRLRAASEEFAALWDLHEVGVLRDSRMRVVHPVIGPIEFDCETLLTPTEDQRLFVFTPPPDGLDGERLELLRDLAREHLTSVRPTPS